MDGLTQSAVDRIVARVARALRAAKQGDEPSRRDERLADHGVWEHMVIVSAFKFIRANPCACSSEQADDFEIDTDNPMEQGYAVLAPLNDDDAKTDTFEDF